MVGQSGVVPKCTPEGVALSLGVREEAGVDVTALYRQALEGDTYFLFPITDYGSEINTIMAEAISKAWV
ncbi:MAG: hypothetical protein R2865_03010 [Deinococcales bacterium]